MFPHWQKTAERKYVTKVLQKTKSCHLMNTVANKQSCLWWVYLTDKHSKMYLQRCDKFVGIIFFLVVLLLVFFYTWLIRLIIGLGFWKKKLFLSTCSNVNCQVSTFSFIWWSFHKGFCLRRNYRKKIQQNIFIVKQVKLLKQTICCTMWV